MSLVTTPSRAVGAPASTSNPLKHATPTVPIPPSPGTFRHPRLTEIIKRQSAASLTTQKIQNAMVNAIAIGVTLALNDTIHKLTTKMLAGISIPPSVLSAATLILLLRVLFMVNIVMCLRPVLSYTAKQDDAVDIPLTPSQRALLGLTPSKATPNSASATYITPPRYRRDGGMEPSTSVHNSPLGLSAGQRSISANYASPPTHLSHYTVGSSASPQLGQMHPARGYRLASESALRDSFSGSPLPQRSSTDDLAQSTFTTIGGRGTLGMSTSSLGFGLSRSQSLRDRKAGSEDVDNLPATPSPSGAKRQPGVNYKWLYDKGARLPRSESTAF